MTRKAAAVTMRQALADPALLGGVLAGELWGNWTTFLIATNGEKLNAAERKIFQKFTGREREPGERVEEALFLDRQTRRERSRDFCPCQLPRRAR